MITIPNSTGRLRRPAFLLSLCATFLLFAGLLPRVALANDPLYCQPNEGNTFNIISGQTFSIATDCGNSAIVSGPSHGTLTQTANDEDGDPTWIYTATNGFTGTDTFVVSVSSSEADPGQQGNFNGGGGNETVTLNVGTAPPVASNAMLSTAYNMANSLDLASSISGGETSVTISGNPSHGSVSVSGTVVTYTPSAGFYGGSDAFTYYASNSGGDSNNATVSVTVGPPPAPTANSGTASTTYHTASAINMASSVNGVDVTITLVSGPAHGTASVNGETVTYTPAVNFTGGTDAFTYSASNPGGTSNTASIVITVSSAPTLGTATAVPTASATINRPASFTPVTGTGGVPPFTYAITPSLPTGVAFSNTAGTVSGTPTDTSTQTSYTVTVTDHASQTAQASFLLTVNPAVTAVSSTPTDALTEDQTAMAFTPVSATGGTAPLTYTVSPALPPGLSLASGSGLVSGTPTASVAATPYTVTAMDSNGSAANATFTLTVQPVPSEPGQMASTSSANSLTLHVVAGTAGAPFTKVAIATPPPSGRAVVVGLDIVYIPDPALTVARTVTFTYTITNQFGTSSPITMPVSVTPANQPISFLRLPPPPLPYRVITPSVSASTGGAA